VLKNVDVFLPNEQEASKLVGTGDLDSALDALSRLVPVRCHQAVVRGALAKAAKTAFMLLPFSSARRYRRGRRQFQRGFPAQIHFAEQTFRIALEYGIAAAGSPRPVPAATEAFRDRHTVRPFCCAAGKRSALALHNIAGSLEKY